jgi:hypothetical protein
MGVIAKISTLETTLDLTNKSRKLAWNLKPESKNIIICGVNATEPDKIIPYTGKSSSQFGMDHEPHLRTIEHSINIQPDEVKGGSLR